MSYIKHVKSIRGMDVQWLTPYIFPDYKDTSGSVVSNKRLKRAKEVVLLILLEEQEKIKNAYKTLAKRKYKDKKISIKYDFNGCIDRVYNTVLGKKNDDLHGESDGYKIWISKNKLNDSYLIGTILHESLHYAATFNNKEICEKDEHYVMELLGETLEC
jgi:hypothetical protein